MFFQLEFSPYQPFAPMEQEYPIDNFLPTFCPAGAMNSGLYQGIFRTNGLMCILKSRKVAKFKADAKKKVPSVAS